jgi:hypothetical protein
MSDELIRRWYEGGAKARAAYINGVESAGGDNAEAWLAAERAASEVAELEAIWNLPDPPLTLPPSTP